MILYDEKLPGILMILYNEKYLRANVDSREAPIIFN